MSGPQHEVYGDCKIVSKHDRWLVVRGCLVEHRYTVTILIAVALLVAAIASPAGAAQQQRPVDPKRSLQPSVARLWDEQLLSAIRIDIPNPPAHARNLFHLSVAMWDAWAAYDPVALSYLVREKHAVTQIDAARAKAISY